MIKNLLNLSLIQLLNLIFPIIVYPIILNRVGLHNYGLILQSLLYMNLANVIITYGFNTDGPKFINENQNNIKVISSYLLNVSILKLFLFIVSLLIINAFTFFFNNEYFEIIIINSACWIILYEIFIPTWFYQSIEKLKILALLNLVNKIFTSLFLIIIIKNEEDYIYFNFINLFSIIITSLFSIYYIQNKYKLTLENFTINKLKKLLVDSFSMFVSNLTINIYLLLPRVIISFYCSMTTLSYYDFIEKIITILKMAINIISQSAFNYMLKYKDINYGIKLILKSILFHAVILIIFNLFFDNLINLLFNNFTLSGELIYNIKLYSTIVILIAVSNIIGINILIPFNQIKFFKNTTIIYSLIYFSIIFIFVYLKGINLSSILILNYAIELCITLTFVFKLKGLYNDSKKI